VAFCPPPVALQALEVLHEVTLLCVAQTQVTHSVIVCDHPVKRGRAAVVEVWRVLPEGTQRCGPVLLIRGNAIDGSWPVADEAFVACRGTECKAVTQPFRTAS
jgi:hypothetical protein